MREESREGGECLLFPPVSHSLSLVGKTLGDFSVLRDQSIEWGECSAQWELKGLQLGGEILRPHHSVLCGVTAPARGIYFFSFDRLLFSFPR
jgi:hypothetical protein